MKLTPEQAEAAKKRRLKEPLEITGYNVVVMKLSLPGDKLSLPGGKQRTREVFATRRIETIGDLAKLDAHIKVGKFIPLPDLSLQALLIVIDKIGLLEEKEEKPDE